ncbi:TonB-dependent receptor [Pseudoxanthomonas winnipegensis]|uniref:TonB-dependent siderophore receptor n=1 Tax=Pseudoxanthomonas winnipegensis TaxID=2480810 RepID=UPI0030F42C40
MSAARRSLSSRLPAFVCSPLAVALLLALSASPAAAQSTTDGKDVKELDKLQVKGKRESEGNGALGDKAAVDTPFSVNSVDAQQLEKYQPVSLLDVFARDASVSRSAGSDYNGWSSRLVVRGLPLSFEDSMKVNGMPTALFGVNLPLEMMDQVQILKGASGFMYGFGQPGGIVNYVTKKPAGDVASVDLFYRTDAVFGAHVDYGGQSGDDGRFGYRLNATHEAGSFYSGGEIHRDAAAVALQYKIAPDLVLSVDALYQDRRIDEPTPYFYPWAYALKYLPKGVTGRTNYSSPATLNYNTFSMLTSSLRWDFAPNWSATLSAGELRDHYRLKQEYFELDGPDGRYDDWVFDGKDAWDFRFIQGLVQGGLDTGPLRHDLVVGASWQLMKLDLGDGNIGSWAVIGSARLADRVRLAWTAAAATHNMFLYSQTEQFAAFGSDTIHFSDRWSALLGARFNSYRQVAYTWDTTDVSVRYRKPVWTPTVALMFKPTPDSTLYLSYVESLEQGTTVGSWYANAGQQLGPIQSDQYELGYKIETGALTTGAALFRINRGAEYANAANVYVQDGNLRYDGLELEARYHFTPQFEVGTSAIWMDATYDKTGTPWLVGRQLAGTPRFSATADASYAFDAVPGLAAYASMKWYGQTAVYNNVASQATVYAKGYAVTDLGGSYATRWGGHPTTIRLGVDNVFDRNYWQGGFNEFAIGAPRTVALNLKLDF